MMPRAGSLGLVLVAMAWLCPASSGASGLAPWPLGAFALAPGGVNDCPPGFECARFEVSSCPDVTETARGELAVASPAVSPRGLVAFFDGGTGQSWWGNRSSLAARFQERLRRGARFKVVQVRWVSPWLASAPREDSGSAHLACRPATVIRWIHDNMYAEREGAAGAGVCGFCITGTSGGASGVSYALSFFGLDQILDAMTPTSGPPHAAQAKGCQPGFPAYAYGPNAALVDASYGFVDPRHHPGPCAQRDPAWIPRWQEESVETGGNDYSHPSTRIEFVIGSRDPTGAPFHATDYRDRLEADPANGVTWTLVAGMPHDIQLSKDGLAALEAALLRS